jgi:hypothetical protein
MHCRLLVPNLLPPASSSIPVRHPPPSGLAALLKYGRVTKMPGKDLADWLCRAFGVEQQDNPVAPYALLADGGAPGDGYWLRADPVTIQLMRNQLILLAASASAPSEAEAAELVDALNQHFSPDELQFSAPHPRRWYLRLPAPAVLRTHSLAEVNGRNIRHYLPSGEDNTRWRKLLNEAQMLLHHHPLNAAREAAGQLPINSVWLWGGGTLSANLSASCDQLFADDPLARGLAIAACIPHAPLPPCVPGENSKTVNAPLFVVELLRDTMRQDDAWWDCLAQLDKDWLSPAIQALRRGSFKRLTLIAPGEPATIELTLTRHDLWKFWRRGSSFFLQ